MPVYKYLKNYHRRICLGDLDRKITIFNRDIVPPTGGGVDFDESFTMPYPTWAMLKTQRGKEIFDGVSVKGIATHVFYIKFRSDITMENWILFNGDYYNILSVEDLDERHEFQALNCSITGSITAPSTEAGDD